MTEVMQIRKIGRMTRSTPQRIEQFHAAVRQYSAIADREFRLQQATVSRTREASTSTPEPPMALGLKVLLLDVVTRWNSMVMMLERAFEYKGV
jgi:hypothetical protein